MLHLYCQWQQQQKRKEEAYPWKAGTSSGHITNLKQSILETFDIYGLISQNGTACFKNVNNSLNTNIYSYLETSGGQSSYLYLNVAHFFNISVNWTSVAAQDNCFLALGSNTFYCVNYEQFSTF